MSLALATGGWILLALPLLLSPLARRITPREFVSAGIVSIFGGLLALEVGLLTTAMPTVLRSAGLTGLAVACERSFRPLAAGGAPIAWAAGLGALVIAALTARALVQAMRGQRRARADLWLGAHHDRGEFDLVIVPADAPLAYSVGGARPQVVLSEGLVATLEPDELEVVISHEAAHIRASHDRYLMLIGVTQRVTGWLPGVRAAMTSVRAALERWADEDAVGADRQRRKRLRDALLATAYAMTGPDLAAFGAMALVERAAALADPPSKASRIGRMVTWFMLTFVLLVAVWTLAMWLTEARSALAMARYCPS